MSSAVAEAFRQAAKLNSDDPRRKGNVVHVEGEIIVSGDIHGNRRGLAKIIGYAALNNSRNRCLVIQEIIHGPLDPASGHDRSVELMLRAARLKINYPEKVLFLLGNHDVAQLAGGEITKEGRGVCNAFAAGLADAFGEEAEEVMQAVFEFIRSMPLAVRSRNGVFIAHSLPSPGRMEAAGVEILQRPYVFNDFHRGGSVYDWTWGRNQTDEQMDALARKLDVKFFILGHRHLRLGAEPLGTRAITIDCSHEQGAIISFSDDKPLDLESALQQVVTVNSIATPG